MKKVINICMYIFLAIFTLEMVIKVQFYQNSNLARLIPQNVTRHDRVEAKIHRAEDTQPGQNNSVHVPLQVSSALLNYYFIE